MTRALATAVLAAALFVVVHGLAACERGDERDEWAVATTGDLVIGVDVTGKLRSTDSVSLGPPLVPQLWNFKIAHLAPEGSAVAAGEMVLAFDPGELQQELRRMENERDAAAAELDTKRRSVELEGQNARLQKAQVEGRLDKATLKVDVPKDLTATLELEMARLDRRLADAESTYLDERAVHVERRDGAELAALEDKRRRAAERVREIQRHIGSLAVVAPRAGTLVLVESWRGEKKKVGDQVWRVERVVEVVSLDSMKAEGEVDEMDASKIAVGQRVTLRLDAHPDVELHGSVVVIADTVQRTSPENPVKIARVDIALEGLPGQGKTANPAGDGEAEAPEHGDETAGGDGEDGDETAGGDGEDGDETAGGDGKPAAKSAGSGKPDGEAEPEGRAAADGEPAGKGKVERAGKSDAAGKGKSDAAGKGKSDAAGKGKSDAAGKGEDGKGEDSAGGRGGRGGRVGGRRGGRGGARMGRAGGPGAAPAKSEDSGGLKMLPGMRFRGTVETGRIEGAVLLPLEAVFVSPDGPVVYRKTDDGVEAVRVEIAGKNRTHVAIGSGIAAGDRVSLVDLGAGAGASAAPTSEGPK